MQSRIYLREKAQKCVEIVTLLEKLCHLRQYLHLTLSLQRKKDKNNIDYNNFLTETRDKNACNYAKPLRHNNQAIGFGTVAMVATNKQDM